MPPGDAVREVKERLDIVEVISSYVRLQRAGREYRGLCPFHSEKSPSFYVSAEKQLWSCFGCGAGGDLFGFVEKAEGLDFRQALEMLAEKAGVTLEEQGKGRQRRQERERAREANKLAAQYFNYVLLSHRLGARGLRYLRDRGVEDETIASFDVGYAPAGRNGDNLLRFLQSKGLSVDEAIGAGLALGGDGRRPIDRFRGRLIIPIRDDSGVIVGFGGRAMDSTPPKYMNSPQTAIYDKGRTIFGLSHARKSISDQGRALLVEGYFDVMMAHQNGITTAVASSGTAVTDDQLKTLRRFAGDLLLCLDSDDAGRLATQRTIEMASKAGMRVTVAELPNAKDPGDFFQRTPELWDAVEGSALAGWEWWIGLALAGYDLKKPDSRAAAAGALVGILNKIPEEATLDIYCQFAAERLAIDPARLLADVQRIRKGGSPHPEPSVAAGAMPQVSRNGSGGDRPDEDRLLQILLADARSAALLSDLVSGEDVGTPQFKDLCFRLRENGVAASSLERHLDRFNPDEGARLARLALTSAAFEDDAELRAAMSDCVDRIRLRDYEDAMAEVQVQLAETGIAGESREALREQHHALAKKRASLKERLFRGHA